MPHTHSRAGGNNGNDGARGSGLNGHDNEDLPPPTLIEMMAMLAKGQRAMGEAMHTMAQQVT